MPGFFINGNEGPDSVPTFTEDWLRSHRFRMRNFFGQITDQRHQKEFMALKDVTMPNKKIIELAITTPGTTYKFAKQANYSDLIISFYGTKTLLAKCLQMADKAHNTRDGIGDYQDYKGIVIFEIYDSTPIGSSALEYTYRNAWISEIKHGQISYSSSEIMMISATIKSDYFDVALIKKGNGQSIVNNNIDSPPESILEAGYNGETSR